MTHENEHWMRMALGEARKAIEHHDVPIGAVAVLEGRIIGRGHNERERLQDPTAHAEIHALREAASYLKTWYLTDVTLYVTLEPCSMCAGAIVLARIPRLIYGATDPKAGAVGSVLDVIREPRLNHHPVVKSGVLADDCAELLRAFFEKLRGRGG